MDSKQSELLNSFEKSRYTDSKKYKVSNTELMSDFEKEMLSS